MSWNAIFWLSALFNFIVGLPLLFRPAFFFSMVGMPPPSSLLFVQIAGLLIAVIGIGYGFAAVDPVRHRVMIVLGAIGKPVLPILFYLYYAAGEVPLDAFLLSWVDGSFGIVFVIFLLTTTRGEPS